MVASFKPGVGTTPCEQSSENIQLDILGDPSENMQCILVQTDTRLSTWGLGVRMYRVMLHLQRGCHSCWNERFDSHETEQMNPAQGIFGHSIAQVEIQTLHGLMCSVAAPKHRHLLMSLGGMVPYRHLLSEDVTGNLGSYQYSRQGSASPCTIAV